MAGAVELAVAYVSIVAETSKLAPSVRRGLSGVEKEGRQAGRDLGREFTAGVESTTNLDTVTRRVTESKGAAARASAALEQAVRKERDTAGSLAIAEARLSELREKGTAKQSQVLRAEQAVERARRANVSAQNAVSKAYGEQFAAHGRLMGSTARLSGEQGKLTDQSGLLAANTGKVSNTFSALSGKQSGLVTGFGQIGVAQGKAAGTANDLATAQVKIGTAASPLVGAQGRVASALGAVVAAQDKGVGLADKLAAAQGRVGSAFSLLTTSPAKAAGAINSVGDASARASDRTGIVARSFQRLGIDADTSAGAVSRAKVQLREVFNLPGSEKLANYGPMLKAGLVSGLGAAAVSSVNLEKTFSTTMRQVESAAQVPADDMKRLNDLAIKLGSDTSFSAGEAGEAMLALAKAGVAPATIEAGALSAALTQASASGDTLEESANAIGNALNMFSLKGEDASKVAAAFAGGANASTAEVNDLTLGLAQVGPGAAAMGHSINDVVGSLAAFNNAGLRGSDAGTSLKQMLTSLVPASDPAIQAMESLGLYTEDTSVQLAYLADNGMGKVKNNSKAITQAFIDLAKSQLPVGASTEEISEKIAELKREAGGVTNAFFDANGEMKSTTEIAQLLQDATKNLSDEERTYALNKIFGSDASRAANIMAKEGAAGLSKYIDATKNAAAAQDMANARMGGTAGALERLSGAWETFRLQIGQALAPLVVAGADALGGALEVMGKSLKVVVPLVAAGAAGWGTWVASVKIAELWAKRQAVATLLMAGAQNGVAAAGAALKAVWAANPFGLALAAVVALGTGLFVLYKQNEGFRNTVNAMAGAVRDFLAPALDKAVTLFRDGFVPALVSTGKAVGAKLMPILRAVGDFLVDRFWPALKEVGAIVTGQVVPALADIGRTLDSEVGGPMREAAKVVADTLGPAFADAGRIIMETVWPALQKAAGAVVEFGKAVIGSPIAKFFVTVLGGIVIGAIEGVILAVKGMANMVAGVVKTIAAVLHGDWSKAWDGVKQIVVGAVQTVWGLLQAGLMGRILGVVRGFGSAMGSLFGASVGRLGSLFSAVIGKVKGVLGAATGAVKGWADSVASAFGQVVGWLTSKVGGAVDAFKGKWSEGWKAAKDGASTAVSAMNQGVLEPLRGWFVQRFPAATTVFGRFMRAAWDTAVKLVGAAFNAIRTGSFEPLQQWVSSLLPAAAAVFKSALSLAWSAVQTAISRVTSFLVKNVFQPVRTWFTSTLTSAANTLKTMVSARWSELVSAIVRFFGNLKLRVLDPVRTWFTFTLPSNAATFKATVSARWSELVSAIVRFFGNLKLRVLDPVRTWFTSTLPGAASTMRTRVGDLFSAMASSLSRVYAVTIKPMFDRMKSLVGLVPGWFRSARDNVGTIWAGIKSKVSDPIRYVVNNVIRDKLVWAWNKVAGKLKLPQFAFPGWADGGWTGPGSKYTPAGVVHADEFVLRKWARRRIERDHPGLLDTMNTTGRVPQDGASRASSLSGQVDSERPGPRMGGRTSPIIGPAPKDQGVWRQMKTWLARNIPGARVTSAYRRTMTATGRISNHARGLAVDIVGSGGTSMMDIFNKILGTFGGRSIELIHSQAGGRQIYRGRPHYYTGVTRANHFDHVHWSIPSMDPNIPAWSGGDGSGWSIPNPIAEWAKGIVNPVFKGARGLADAVIGRFGQSAWTDITRAAAKLPVDQVEQWLIAKIDQMFPAYGAGGDANEGQQVANVGSGVQRWAVIARKALALTGQPLSLLPSLLRRMQQESGGNPNAVNNWDINAKRGTPSKGLMQVIGPTFRAHAMPGYSSNIFDPLSNILASIRYALSRYGNLRRAYDRRGGYAEGGRVVPLPHVKLFDGGGMLRKGDIAFHAASRPDRVLTERQWTAVERYLPITAEKVHTPGARTGGGDVIFNGPVWQENPDALARAIERRRADQMALLSVQGVA